MKRAKKDAASFQQLGVSQMEKIKGGKTIVIINPDGSTTTMTI